MKELNRFKIVSQNENENNYTSYFQRVSIFKTNANNGQKYDEH